MKVTLTNMYASLEALRYTRALARAFRNLEIPDLVIWIFNSSALPDVSGDVRQEEEVLLCNSIFDSSAVVYCNHGFVFDR